VSTARESGVLDEELDEGDCANAMPCWTRLVVRRAAAKVAIGRCRDRE
jgi:hypothetical protein